MYALKRWLVLLDVILSGTLGEWAIELWNKIKRGDCDGARINIVLKIFMITHI